jgi:hypothetical protein
MGMSADDIRRKAKKFQKKVFWENALNYFLGLAGAAFLSFRLVWHGPNALIQLGGGLVVAAVLYMLWQTHRRSSFRRAPAEMGIVSCLEFHRKELERRRDLHRSVWRWGLGPAIPGCVVLMVGIARINPGHVRHWGWTLLAVNTVAILAFAYAWMQSERRAHKLQAQIDELDALRELR